MVLVTASGLNSLEISWESPGNANIGGEVGVPAIREVTVDWDPNPGNPAKYVIEVSADHSDSTVAITQGTSLASPHGFFSIDVDGFVGQQIPTDATPFELQEALESLPNVGSVQVLRSVM